MSTNNLQRRPNAASAASTSAPSSAANASSLQFDFSSIEGLRGVSSLIIVFGHLVAFFCPSFGPNGETLEEGAKIVPVIGVNYFLPVTVFLLLSGFSLGITYPADSDKPSPSYFTFLLRRLARILPLYWISILSSYPDYKMWEHKNGAEFAWTSFIHCMTLIQGITLQWSIINPPLWTLSTILTGYFLFQPMNRFFSRQSPTTLFHFLFWLCIMPVAIAVFLLSSLGLDGAALVHMWFLFRIPAFLVGLIGSILFQRATREGSASAVYRLLRNHSTKIIWFCTFLYFLDTIGCAYFTTSDFKANYFWNVVVEYSAIPIVLLFILALGCKVTNDQSTVIHSFLSSSPARRLGTISYSLYCFHWPVIMAVLYAKSLYTIGDGWALKMSVPSWGIHFGFFYFRISWVLPLVILCVIVANVVYEMLEKPLRKTMQKWF